MIGLTARQEEVLTAIHDRIVRDGIPPTLRELGADLGIKSTNGVNDHLRALERKGCIGRKSMRSRAMLITDKGLRILDVAIETTSALILRGSAVIARGVVEGSSTLTIDITDQARSMLVTLADSGLFGDTAEQVCERLLYEKLRDVLRDVKR